MLAAPLTVLSIGYALVFYVNSSLLTAPRTVLSIRYPPVVYMLTAPLNVLNIRYPPVVYINSPSHSFKHKVTVSSLC